MREPHRFPRLWIESLEDRLTPAVTVRFDYSFDTSGMFANPSARAAMDRVGAALAGQMTDTLSAITPSAANTWTPQVYDSASGTTKSLPGLSVAADEVVVFITGGQLGGALGIASGGAYSARGSQAWLDVIRTRGQSAVDAGTDFSPWGGLIAFNTATNWDFTAGAPASNQFDFDSVALHELMHVFGFGLNNPSFTRYVSNGFYTGPNAVSVYGGSIPMQPGTNTDHFAQSVTYAGQSAIMNPAIQVGVQKRMTDLEYASLRDIGWSLGATTPPVPVPPPAVTVPPVTAPAPVPTTPSAVTPATNQGATLTRFAVSADTGGTGGVSVFDGTGQMLSRAPGVSAAGGTRVATGDVNGDGVPDVVYGAPIGEAPTVTVVSGTTGQVISQFLAYEPQFLGGVNVSVGYLTGGTRADIVTGADAGGGPRVRVFQGGNPNAVVSDFWGIEDMNFRGGVRLAVGDLNGDGRDDLVAAAGLGGGPRIAMYDGRTVAAGRPQKFAGDFFAFAPTFNGGTYVAVADLTGDGFGDLIVGAGEGGGPRVTVFSGRELVRGVYTSVVADFFSGASNTRSGIRVAARDVTGDGRPDLLTAPAPGTDGTVRVYAAGQLAGGVTPPTFLELNSPGWLASGAFVG
ncbi:MAG: FG-GAP-like repeat-containing protein [Fimbriiglobus sp.]|jgi:hypothetical protein|nr:FG-GAP-like repeat-containing protein [Fimbriiglobus sp.]